jgi:hypothetical protein
MSKRCLLLRTSDNKGIFTYEKYHHTLLEFAKSFNIEILTVEANYPNLLHPKEIAKAFCNQSEEEFETCSYRVIGSSITHSKTHTNSRDKMLKKVADIRSYIESQFLEGNMVRIKELHHKFQKHNIAVSTLYRHLTYVKERLKKQSKTIVKVSAGCYRLA